MALRLHRVLLAVAAVLLLPEAARACPVCFGSADSHLLDAARAGVLAMAALTVIVLALFGAWFLRLARLETTHSPREDAGERP